MTDLTSSDRANELAEKVRVGLDACQREPCGACDEAIAALSELVVLAAAADQLADALKEIATHHRRRESDGRILPTQEAKIARKALASYRQTQEGR